MIRIKELRKQKNLTQIELSKIFGITQAALSGWETGKYQPDHEILFQLADFFNCSTDYLLGRTDDMVDETVLDKVNEIDNELLEITGNIRDAQRLQKLMRIKIPVLGKVVAGIPIEAVEEILDYEEITQEMASQGDYFGLQVKGNSMEPKFSEGDVVIVRKQSDVDTGDIAIVLVNGNEATIKKIRKREDGIELVPSNHDYDIAFYSNKQIEELPIVIIGKVVELRAKF